MNFSYDLIKSKSKLKDPNEIELWYSRYIRLIQYSKNIEFDSHTHKHHILPASLFPEFSKNKENILILSYRLHFIAHYILMKMTKTFEMKSAFHLMATVYIKNSRLYSSSILETYEARKNMCSAKNNVTGENELVHISNLGNSHTHTSVGMKWWYNSETGDTLFSEKDMSGAGYENTHRIKCGPTKVYWTTDENGNRCRTDNENKKINGVAPYQRGLDVINKENTKFLNLETKKFVFINKSASVPARHYRLGAYKKDLILIYEYNDILYFSCTDLPEEIQFNIKRNLDIINNVIPDINSYLYRVKGKRLSLQKKNTIEKYGGKTLGQMGLKVYNFLDENFLIDFEKKIFKFDERCDHPRSANE